MTRHIAVIDIGKTNAKLALVNRDTLAEIAVITRPNRVMPGPPWPHFDVEGHWAFLLKGLRDFHQDHGIDAISVTTHGASVVLLDQQGGLAAPILDYEFTAPNEMEDRYNAIRPPFSETGSPRLAGGLNIGAQLHWQFETDPGLKARTHQIVTYPQFWGARLTGETAMDVCSLGCHTDLWNPYEGAFSSLVYALEIGDKLAPVRKPSEILGTLLAGIAKETGLPETTPVFCGIHDSNASLLPYVLSERPPFSVISTGTWVIAMSVGGTPITLDPDLDTLINVTALGDPARSARFMGGREHDIATGGPYPEPSVQDLHDILSNEIMLMPAVAPETGPFKGHDACWIGAEPEVKTGQRGAAVALYLALNTAECLSNIGHDGKVIVEGPFAGNTIFLEMLSTVSHSDVYRAAGTTGTSSGAALLDTGGSKAPSVSIDLINVSQDLRSAYQKYAKRWHLKAQRHCFPKPKAVASLKRDTDPNKL